MTVKQKQPDFEQAIGELERLIETMERGEVTLEETLRQFERGIELVRNCQRVLTQAEQKVEQLLEKDGQITTVSYAEET